ncbi:MAG TPA: dihydrolipoyl dehydrogenase [Solirubrobacterales bacterium]|nr:dihydrolipoyl dehydrogenase [Solirubrobacterales bacterium]
MANQYDVAVIGAGPGGYVAAVRAGQLGLKTVCIEKDERLGGTCLLRGCIPTKALLETADVLEHAQHGEKYGVIAKDVAVDMKGVNAYKDKVVTSNVKGIDFLFRKNKIDRVLGTAKITAPGKISVEGKAGKQEIEAKHIVIASGSAPRLLPHIAIDGKTTMTSDELLQNEKVPRRLLVLGAGAVGIEFASIYKRFGSEVTVIEMLPRLLPVEDEDVSAEMEKALRRKGIKSLTNAKLEKVEQLGEGKGLKATVTTQKGTETLEADVLLVAVGRRPVSENLGLEAFKNVKVERGFIMVDPLTLSAGEPWLSAIGDVVAIAGRPHPQLAHLASAEGIFVMERLAGLKPHPIRYDLVPGATYSDPEVGSVGLTEKQAKEKGHKVKVGVFPFSANSKGKILGATEGFVKIVADEKYDELLGVHIIGPKATELVAEACSLLRLECTSEEMVHVMRAHPTLSEAMTEAAHAVRGKPIHI